ncbi:Uncharacterised protein [Bordetella pertussis]|nr:Uncharacterised protein [Bordetella pertussis]
MVRASTSRPSRAISMPRSCKSARRQYQGVGTSDTTPRRSEGKSWRPRAARPARPTRLNGSRPTASPKDSSEAPLSGALSWSLMTRIGPPQVRSTAPAFTSSIAPPGPAGGSHSISRPSRPAWPSAFRA